MSNLEATAKWRSENIGHVLWPNTKENYTCICEEWQRKYMNQGNQTHEALAVRNKAERY